MSEYYLADQKAEERARQRDLPRNEPVTPAPKQQMKFSLLGDFMFPSNEPQGCDPYNSVQGKAFQEPWRNRHDRR